MAFDHYDQAVELMFLLDADEAVCHQEEVHNEDIAQAIGTAIQVETNSLKVCSVRL